MTDPLPDIAANPEWLPFELDPATDQVTLLRLSEEDYRRASFLDQRILWPGAQLHRTDWTRLAAAVPADARRDAQYIFHLGNVGSTLISRMLGELDAIFALREPLLLRTFAEAIGAGWEDEQARRRLDTLTALLSRTFRPGQRALVKATSFTSEIAGRLVPKGSRALFLFATPQHYIENILAGENSKMTARLLAPARLARLQRRCDGLELALDTLDDGRRAALGWACEMTSLEANAAQLPPGDVLWLDFDLFLADPAAHLVRIADFFGVAADAAAVRAIALGPLLHRYSKALEYEHGPEMRGEILAEARMRHGPAIRDALVWLNGLASRYPAVAQAIRRTQQGGGSVP